MTKHHLLTASLLILLSSIIFAQPPQSFKYQSVLRDVSGQVLANQAVNIGIDILQGSVTGASAFTETHAATTNSLGLVNLDIGSVNVAGFTAIDWTNGPYFVQVSVDGTIMGTSQLLSVPYALHAQTVSNDQVDDADADPTNELQNISIFNNQLSISQGNSVDLTPVLSAVDTSNTNELQDISLSGTDLSISNGSTVDLSVLQDGTGTDSQTLTLNNSRNLEISNGNSVILPYVINERDGNPSNELQTIYKSGLDISLNQNGGTVRDSILTEAQVDAMVANNGYQLSANDNDIDPINEIQVLSISNDTVYLSDGGYAVIPAETDPVFNAWNRSTGVAISESQITDLDHFTGDSISGNETAFDGWDKDASDEFTTSDETDPVYSADSAFVKSGVTDWNSSLARQITATDTTRWGNDSDPSNELYHFICYSAQ